MAVESVARFNRDNILTGTILADENSNQCTKLYKSKNDSTKNFPGAKGRSRKRRQRGGMRSAPFTSPRRDNDAGGYQHGAPRPQHCPSTTSVFGAHNYFADVDDESVLSVSDAIRRWFVS